MFSSNYIKTKGACQLLQQPFVVAVVAMQKGSMLGFNIHRNFYTTILCFVPF
jgi:hypothetical protein